MSERTVDRKAKPESTPNADPADLPDDGGVEVRKGFSNAKSRIADTLPGIPTVSAYGVVVAVLYAAVAAGALSVAYGSTALVTAYGGTHAGLISGGTFAFVYGYVALTAVSTARGRK